MSEHQETIDALMAENRTFPPPEHIKRDALVVGTHLYDEAAADDEGFWARQAGELLEWSREWDTICEWDLPYAKWFVGGQLNVSANCLDRHVAAGVGDRVNIYLPMIPEAAVAMLACARIGAAHSVVFGGFSAQALADRISDAEAKVLITADGGYRRGDVFPLKPAADEAVAATSTIEHVVVVQRGKNDVEMVDGRDHWYHDLVAAADAECPAEPM